MKHEEYVKPVELTAVTVKDSFWNPIMETTRQEMLPYQWRVLNDLEPEADKSGCIRNFRIAAGLEQGEFYGEVFQDSDLAKWIEAAAYSLYSHADAELEAQIDAAVELIAKAQQADGYLGTYYTINGLDKRWTNFMSNHELYCAGHMLEAAVAYYEVSGKRKLLDIMIRFVDYIDSVIGLEEGKLPAYPGHEEIELALIRLYQITKDEKHLKLAKYFIDERGKEPHYFEREAEKYHNNCWWRNNPVKLNYYQAQSPVRSMKDAVGHSVRAVYLYTAMADIARETGDISLYETCRRIWESIVKRRMYITGAIGSSAYGEMFTLDYDLPNDLIYGETCASVGLAFFAKRMLSIEPRGEYADVMETVLYNGSISGMSLDGKRFFYVNPLETVVALDETVEAYRHVKPERQKWFACACCPPNLARLVESLGSYIYGSRSQTLFVHLYIGSKVQQELEAGKVELEMKTNYPWQGNSELHLKADCDMELALRIPSWCHAFTLQVNGKEAEYNLKEGYAYLKISQGETTVELCLEMKPVVLRANQRVREDLGKVAVRRGPVVYCLEEVDNGKELHRLLLAEKPKFEEGYHPQLLGGVMVLKTQGWALRGQDAEELYYEENYEDDYKKEGNSPMWKEEKTLTFVPYYSWNNRGKGDMCVWVRKQV